MQTNKSSKNIDPVNYSKNFWIRLTFIFSLIGLYLPIFSIILYSFNDSRRITIWRGFTINNYFKVFEDDTLREAFLNSFVIAGISTIFSVILGVMSSYLLWRYRFVGSSLYAGLLSLPIVIPEICMGISFLIFFNLVFGSISVAGPWPFNLILIIAAHITFCFPFVSMVISARINLFSFEHLEASFDLGANELKAFWDIVLPFLRPAIISGALLSFTLSLDDFVITFFTSGPDSLTFPIKIYSMLRFSVTPVVNAASTIMIVTTIALTLIVVFLQRKSKMI